MACRDPRIDAYIAASADFARPILTHLREVVHEACPEVEETMKWSMPHFLYHGMLCGMASHKQHCSFGFWKGSLILEGADDRGEGGMGHFGRITTVGDLPSRATLERYVRKAMALNEDGTKAAAPRRPKTARVEPAMPAELAAALDRNEAARAAFERFSPSHRREYVEWIADAKRAETRERRVATALEWLAEGKSRNWKYERA